MELTDGRDHTAHTYSTDIIFPQKIGEKLVYVKQVHVPETLKSGEYKVKICGLLKDGRKLCQKSDAFTSKAIKWNVSITIYMQLMRVNVWILE